MQFSERLYEAIHKKHSRLCVGLDPRLEMLPNSILKTAKQRYGDGFVGAGKAIVEFDRRVIDAIHDVVPAVKFQSAFYEQYGPFGIQSLWEGIHYAKSKDLLVLLDAKRGDIDSTAQAYANAYLGTTSVFDKKLSGYEVDCLTLNPFLGKDSLIPFLSTAERYQKGVFILVKTSNPGSGDFQGKIGDGYSISEQVADFINEQASRLLDSNGYSSVGAVVGATYAKDAVALRKRMPHSFFLVPGIGSQGGSLHDLAHFFDDYGFGALVHSSRGVVYTFSQSNENDFQSCIHDSARKLRDEINIVLGV